jgi:hypothetical protein
MMPVAVFRIEVVEGSSLSFAHGDLQPRDRAGRATSAAQIAEMAANLDPERLRPDGAELQTGSPIAGEDGIIESGNGRLAAILHAYERHPGRAHAYREMCKDYGDSVNVHTMGMPVAIRRRVTPMSHEQRLAFVASCNRSSTATLSAAEQAAADSAALTLTDVADSVR